MRLTNAKNAYVSSLSTLPLLLPALLSLVRQACLAAKRFQEVQARLRGNKLTSSIHTMLRQGCKSGNPPAALPAMLDSLSSLTTQGC
eukprot:6191517-Amphidinium_carterae.1